MNEPAGCSFDPPALTFTSAATAKYRLVVSSRVSRSRRCANSCSSTPSLRQRGANGVRPSCSCSGSSSPQPRHRPIEMMQIEPRDGRRLHARLGSVVIQIKPHSGTSGTAGHHPSSLPTLKMVLPRPC
jgi:hypothetical protein